MIIAFGSMSRFYPLRWLVRTFVWVIRGTPAAYNNFFWPGSFKYAFFNQDVLLQQPLLLLLTVGQYEAGQVLGMTKTQIFFHVTLLQVIKRIVPPIGNEVITLVKDTSLARIIANKEIIMMAGEYSNKGLIWPLFATGIYFLVFVGGLTILLNWVEKKLGYFRVCSMAFLEVKGIEKSFGTVKVLKKIDFSLEKGEVIAIIGPSGSGKTTLLRCLNFLERPDKGSIIVNNEVIFDAMDPSTKRSAQKTAAFRPGFSKF